MRLKRYLQNMSLIKQYILKFVLVMLLPLLMVEIIFYTTHLRTVENDTVHMFHYRMNQAQLSMDLRVKELLEITVKVKNDSRFLTNSLNGDLHLRTQAKQLLYAHNATNKLCDNIQIYYQAFDGVYSSEGFTCLSPFLRNRYAFSQEDADAFSNMLRFSTNNAVVQLCIEGADTLAFLFPLQYNSRQSYSTLFFFVKLDTIKSILSDYLKMESDSRIALLDENRHILFSEIDGIDQILLQDTPTGQGMSNHTLQNERYSVFYRDSTFNHWRYICAIPSQMLVSGAKQQQFLIIQISIMVVLLGLGMAILLAWNSYRPIRKLFYSVGANAPGNELNGILTSVTTTRESYTQLRQLLDKNTPFLVDYALEQFLNGLMDADTCLAKLREIDIDVQLPYYIVAAVGILDREDGASVSEAHQIILQAAIDMNAENAPELNILTLERSFENAILLIMNTIHEWDGAEHLDALMKKLISSGIGEILVVGAGRVYDKFSDIAQSYTEAMIAMEQLRFRGACGLITYEDSLRSDASGIASEMKEKRLQLVQHIRQGNEKMALELLQSIGAGISSNQHSYVSSRCAVFDIANAVVHVAYELSETDFDAEIERVLRMHGVKQTMHDLAQLTTSLCRYIAQMRRDSGKQMGQDMLAYVTQNFAKPDISLDAVAEHFHLSSFYVSRFFSQYAGITFREYITGLRIDRAKSLLWDTDLPVRDIVAQIGYLDPSTFSKRFKQIVGITPGEYRSQRNDGASDPS
ncbi:MAG: helix-turn-helix domain-containing protein [Eubacteriales bacterium]|nr:helix-turn-helix domain-containing protein [Eubacteriales bacterium]